ncbi:hypothetical protein OHA25_40170 [Nonomuraea sp. NBC_00507]|uniref:hypothetical protein n=1 Tax=Nonomuraea sp. NBC_00507 TaxID=2976002 RepID=UPI002E19EA4C
MPSSPIDVLARHLEHVTVADPLTDPLDLPALAEVLDALPDPPEPGDGTLSGLFEVSRG